MSWVRMKMKFPGTCIACGEPLKADETGLWQKGTGVKHEACGATKQLGCAICGEPAGCGMCEFRDECDLERVSRLCLCKKCLDRPDAFSLYLESVKKTAKC